MVSEVNAQREDVICSSAAVINLEVGIGDYPVISDTQRGREKERERARESVHTKHIF